MKIKIHNDGKGKWQSFEAFLGDCPLLENRQFGENQDEAIENLKDFVFKTIQELQSINWNEFECVDWQGNPIKAKAEGK